MHFLKPIHNTALLCRQISSRHRFLSLAGSHILLHRHLAAATAAAAASAVLLDRDRVGHPPALCSSPSFTPQQ